MAFPLIVCATNGRQSSSLLDSSNFTLVSFTSVKQLFVGLIGLSRIEHSFAFPIPIVINVPAVPASSWADSLEDLSFLQLEVLLSAFFPHLNIIILDYHSVTDQPGKLEQILFREVVTNHHFFSKNRFRRMQTLVGLNGAPHDLSLTVFGKVTSFDQLTDKHRGLLNELTSLNVTKTYNDSNYPLLPSFINTIPKNLARVLNQNHNFSSNIHPLTPKTKYNQYLDLMLKNIDFENILCIGDDRKFYIEEFLIESWYFQAHDLTYDELVYVCFLIFKRVFQLFPKDSGIALDDSKLLCLLINVREVYVGGNDFHNFRHAVDVVQAIFYYFLKLNLVPKHSIISKKKIVHDYKRQKNNASELCEDGNCWNHIVDFNEQTIDNNDSLEKEAEELDPSTEYHIYNKSPKLYLNQLKTYQTVIDQEFPTETTNCASETIVVTAYGKFKQREKSQLLCPVEVLALLIAALGHDSGHPGLTNHFIITNRSPLSIIFNDQSILENYHFILFHDVLQRHWPALFDQQIISMVSPGKPVDVKRIIAKSILATDMEKHFSFINQIINSERDALEKIKNGNELPKLEVSSELLCQLLLKCADISNITRPLKLSATWGVILGKEMAEIATLDKILKYGATIDDAKLPDDQELVEHLRNYEGLDKHYDEELQELVNCLESSSKDQPMAEPETHNLGDVTLRQLVMDNPNLCKSQIFFIEQISYKLFEKINEILPWLGFILRILNKNLHFWKLFEERAKK
ncbi:3',5'-cyclic-nucleotide phosphodiesterase [Saccharomycopsis crataegensis]|uniref:3',5'-cyclic-nucleotide phosphodiesterase n=1 Tax=Saccharomycopsis crataegensis TaxID=43959 RepID=A0AAV5QMC7_9ASCO|nr:3',5'-cyclic-nucleotide phosphodiesterase [Saccharomycopsis crataegensis]